LELETDDLIISVQKIENHRVVTATVVKKEHDEQAESAQ
jgi:hypothetical protein